jgi:hypothetical protein
MLKRERTCHYLREVSKQGWRTIADTAKDQFMYLFADSIIGELRQHSYELRQMLDEASKTGTYTKSIYSE